MKFLREVEKIGLRLDHNITGDKWAAGVMSGATRSKDKYMIVKIYAPFQLLSKTAERMKLKMPLTEVVKLERMGCFQRLLDHFKTETVMSTVSAHYEHEKRHLFKGIGNEETFFRPALRSLIVNGSICCDIFLEREVISPLSYHIEHREVNSRNKLFSPQCLCSI